MPKQRQNKQLTLNRKDLTMKSEIQYNTIVIYSSRLRISTMRK